MPKLAKFRRRHAKKNPGEPKRNGPIGSDIVEYIAPGFAAFAATRFLTRVAAVQISKRWPKYAKHAGAIASVGSFAAAWLGAHKVKYLEKYHHPIVVGSGLAAIQSLIQLYLPMVGWMVSDASPELGAAKASSAVAGGIVATSSLLPSMSAAQAQAAPPVPDGFTQTDANTWFSYNDSYDAGGYRGQAKAPPPSPMTSAAPDDQQIDDLLDDGSDDSNSMGSFS
jgi:hypothetical protein